MKNQLGIVLGFSDLLLTELDASSPHRSDLAEIHAAAERALDLIGRMPGSEVETNKHDQP
jgi:hypothetical protein